MAGKYRLALGIAYCGQPWHGWQKQPHQQTVQDQLEQALESFLNVPCETICAGRTDTGVHAFEQVVHLDTAVPRPEQAFVRGLNALLPQSIRIQWALKVDREFHARFSAQSRHYFYILRHARVPVPFDEGRVGWVYRPLALLPMQQAAQLLLGTRDFSAFRSAQCQAHSPVRELQRLTVTQQGEYFIFHFQANAFLHHMIRNLMGTLVYIGMGRQPVHWVEQLLTSRDRRRAAPTFSPAGLYLARVDYSPHWGLPQMSLESLLHRHLALSYDKV